MAAVELAIEAGTATLLVNRPDSLNALSSEVLRALDAAVARVEGEPSVRGVIVTGAGRAFVAGADIAEIGGLDRARGLEFSRRGQAVFSRIEALRKPVVAAVNGFALGGGCELALACHIRIATAKARFGQPEVRLGILPGFGATQRLPRAVGRGIATELIATGRMIAAEEALRIGLVSAVVEPEDLLPRAQAILEESYAMGPRAVAAALEAIAAGIDLPLDQALEVEARAFAELCGTEEMLEGTRAFIEKRAPKF